MELGVLASAFANDPSSLIGSGLQGIHVLGFVLGIGAATLMEVLLVRAVAEGTVTGERSRLIQLSSRAVIAGLLMIWVTGLLMMAQNYLGDHRALGGEAVWTRLIALCILSINCILIHETVLPLVRRQRGRPLFAGLGASERGLIAISMAVSAMSWYLPLVISRVHQFDRLADPRLVLTLYAILLLGASALAPALMRAMMAQQRTIWLPAQRINAINRQEPAYVPIEPRQVQTARRH